MPLFLAHPLLHGSSKRDYTHKSTEDRAKTLSSVLLYIISVVPSPRNHAVYKTNLTNRHEKILMSVTKVII